MASSAADEPNWQEWIVAARAGSPEALGKMLEACRLYLLLVANEEIELKLRPKLAPSDLVQETFLEAHRDFVKFQGDSKEEVQAWLRAILRHTLANIRRSQNTEKRGGDREVPLSDELTKLLEDQVAARIPRPEDDAMTREEKRRLQEAIDQLPDDYRLVIELRCRDGFSWPEAGESMGRSAEAVRKLYTRAIEELIRILGLDHGSK